MVESPLLELPIDELLAGVVESLKSRHQNLVLIAAPGAGKTTRVAPALIRAKIDQGKNQEILLLQPRQVAARSIAQRIALEQGWQLGREVGYQVRFENRTGPATKLKLVTEGILTRRLQSDPYLESVGTVILDEFHERSVHTDLAIALLRELQREARPDLRIVVMSATIDPLPIAKFLGGCPIFESRGRLFPVEYAYLQKQVNTLDFHELMAVTAQAIKSCDGPGHALVFLPGSGEINYLTQALQDWAARERVVILPLHGRLPPEEQDLALKPSTQRKIILATNIAETSLTIDGVSRVIDSGLARVSRVDWNLGITKLELARISLASATQRAGRAGRQGPGKCYRLWSTHDERSFSPSQEPEIMRMPLNEPWLFLADQGYTDPFTFSWFQAPPPTPLRLAVEQLKAMGALNKQTGAITPSGRELLQWPLAPRFARLMIDAGKAGLTREGALFAALLSERDIFRAKSVHSVHGKLESDLLIRAEAANEFEEKGVGRSSDLDARAVRTVMQLRDQIVRLGQSSKIELNAGAVTEVAQLKLLLGAFSDRVCRRRTPQEARALMVGSKGVRLEPSSCVRQAEFFIALEVQDGGNGGVAGEPIVRLASAIEKSWLKQYFAEDITVTRQSYVDENSGKVFSITAESFRDLPLEEGRKVIAEKDDAAALLSNYLFKNFDKHFNDESPAARWIARYEFAVVNMPDNPWPAFREDILKPALVELTFGCQSLAQVFERSIVELFQGKLSRALQKILVNEVPESMPVPSGSHIKISYVRGRPPTAEVRLQEVFGMNETPRLALGKVPVILHLLSPGFKPVQVTSDLKSFWKNTYFEVRKELKGRYPKHSWPEDPLVAKAEAKGRRRH